MLRMSKDVGIGHTHVVSANIKTSRQKALRSRLSTFKKEKIHFHLENQNLKI